MDKRKASLKQEKAVAKSLNAKVVAGSGCVWSHKADVRTDKYLLECKTTSFSTYRLYLKTWDKIKKEALKDGIRTPVMCVELDNRAKPLKVAVFEKKDFCDFKLYDIMTREYPDLIAWQKSVLVDEHTGFSVLVDKTHLVLMSWDDFIDMTESGEYEAEEGVEFCD